MVMCVEDGGWLCVEEGGWSCVLRMEDGYVLRREDGHAFHVESKRTKEKSVLIWWRNSVLELYY